MVDSFPVAKRHTVEDFVQKEIEYLSRFVVTKGLREEEMLVLHRILTPRTFAPDEKICTEGGEADGMFLITKGFVMISRTVTGGHTADLVPMSAPTVVGEINLITGGMATANVVARSEIHAALLSHDAFEALHETNGVVVAKLIRNIARVLATRLDATTAELVRRLGPEHREGAEKLKLELGSQW